MFKKGGSFNNVGYFDLHMYKTEASYSTKFFPACQTQTMPQTVRYTGSGDESGIPRALAWKNTTE